MLYIPGPTVQARRDSGSGFIDESDNVMFVTTCTEVVHMLLKLMCYHSNFTWLWSEVSYSMYFINNFLHVQKFCGDVLFL